MWIHRIPYKQQHQQEQQQQKTVTQLDCDLEYVYDKRFAYRYSSMWASNHVKQPLELEKSAD